MAICYTFSSVLSFWLSHAALRRKALRKPLGIGAVVVDHVVPLHPPEPLLARGVQLLGQPGVAGAARPRHRGGGATGGGRC